MVDFTEEEDFLYGELNKQIEYQQYILLDDSKINIAGESVSFSIAEDNSLNIDYIPSSGIKDGANPISWNEKTQSWDIKFSTIDGNII